MFCLGQESKKKVSWSSRIHSLPYAVCVYIANFFSLVLGTPWNRFPRGQRFLLNEFTSNMAACLGPQKLLLKKKRTENESSSAEIGCHTLQHVEYRKEEKRVLIRMQKVVHAIQRYTYLLDDCRPGNGNAVAESGGAASTCRLQLRTAPLPGLSKRGKY